MLTTPALITALTLVLYQVVSFQVGRMRGKHGIKAPATQGHEEFNRALRVQMNTLEQLVYFIPSLWLFFLFAPTSWAEPVGTLLGAVWILARIDYARGYYALPRKRMGGFVVSLAAASFLLLGGVIGILGQTLSIF